MLSSNAKQKRPTSHQKSGPILGVERAERETFGRTEPNARAASPVACGRPTEGSRAIRAGSALIIISSTHHSSSAHGTRTRHRTRGVVIHQI